MVSSHPENAYSTHRRADTAAGAPAAGAVVVYPGNALRSPCSHESATYTEVARRLATVKGYEYAGEFDQSLRYGCPLYFVPSDTFVTIESARELGILGEHDLFGGVVPFAFIATKTITHPLPGPRAVAPKGWSFDFAVLAGDAVLPGFSVFSIEDARRAGAGMLAQGPVRIKKPSGAGGLGQWVATGAADLESLLQSLDASEVMRDGLVLERNLTDVTTLSVGQVRVGSLLATYYGTQRLTANNAGEKVYGGSDLIVVRGDFDALLRLDPERDALTAIAQTRSYHAAVMKSYPGMFASRCNYDVAQGYDHEGRWRSGVLEQSWRIGGASGAEAAALCAFREDPSLHAVRASTAEVYGDAPALPADAEVSYCGVDEAVGAITKYSRLEPYAHP